VTRRLTKAEKAYNIVARLDGKVIPRILVHRIMVTCELRKPAARTYLYNARIKVKRSMAFVTNEFAFTAADEQRQMEEAA
jgi:hypothetical protein